MKALTLHQPYAYLIGLGVKPFETRPRRTHIRGLVAIHASEIQADELNGLVIDNTSDVPEFHSPFDRHLPGNYNDYFGDINHGGIECLAVIKDCFRTEDARIVLKSAMCSAKTDERRRAAEEALAFGDFSDGRFAYAISVRLHVGGAIGGVIRGHQGWWNVSEQLERELLEAYKEVTGEYICRVCGCTNNDACTPPCSWAAEFLCTACKEGAKR